MRRCAAAWSNISTRSDFIALPKDRTPRNNAGIVFLKKRPLVAARWYGPSQ
jgi:hypothetical protein